MARLQLISPGFEGRIIELNLGVNRFGRRPDNHFQIEHGTVSGRHCEIELGLAQLLVRDCDSTNGTYLDGQRITQAVLIAGQVLRLGEVECLVEDTEVRVAVPKLQHDRPTPPRMTDDGGMFCPDHETLVATHRCKNCLRVMCRNCVRRLRRRGGKLLLLCPHCSGQVESVRGEVKRRRSLIDFLKTVKLPSLGLRSSKKRNDSEDI